MLLRVLGPLEVLGRDGPVPLGAAKPRALLAALALSRGTISTSDDLIDALWGESPPPSAPKLLQVYVSQLRKALPAGLQIVTSPTGYALDVSPADLDAAVFERLVDDGRAALRAANPALAASTLARGLALWRGPAYADVRYEPFALEEIERLERIRDLALLDRVDADLQLGRHADVLGELRGLLAADPTREDIAARAMLAAYRTAGPTEALAIFATVQTAVLDDLGEAPNRELIALRARVEQRDPTLDLEPDQAATVRAGPPLPIAPNALIGRRRELDELPELLRRPGVRLVSLTGAGGSGKSRLALELASQLEHEYANGAVLVELASLGDPSLVLASIARGFGLDPGQDPLVTIRDAFAAREVLLVLDNVEHLRSAAPDLVSLLAAAPHLTILATTRVVLHVSGEHVYPVAPLPESDASALFTERATAHDNAFVLDAVSEPTINAICRRLDGLPLAIELAAARVRALGLRTLDARLASRLTTLTGGPRDLPARQQTLRETLAWSVNLLEPRLADVLAALAVFPGSCSIEAAAAVAGADDESLITLVDHNLVQVLDFDGERRFRLLETVREYAIELLGSRREEAESALASWMVGVVVKMAQRARGMGLPSPQALRRLDAEVDNLRQGLEIAARDAVPDRELAMAASVWHFWFHRGYISEGRARYEAILERRGVVPTRDGIRTVRAAASFAYSQGDYDRSVELCNLALEAAVAVGDLIEQAGAHNLLGVLANAQHDGTRAEAHLVEAIRLAEADGDIDAASMPRLNLGVAYVESGRLDEAREEFRALLEYRDAEGLGLTEGVGLARINLGEVEYAAGNLAAAEEWFVAAAEAFRAIGFRVRLASALQGQAAVEARSGRAESAAMRLGAASALLTDVGWVRDGLALEEPATNAAREALGDETFERLFAEGFRSGSAQGGIEPDGA